MLMIPCRNKQPLKQYFSLTFGCCPQITLTCPLGKNKLCFKEFRHKYKRDCDISFAEIFLNVDLMILFEKRNVHVLI